jgi:hypothetical protein
MTTLPLDNSPDAAQQAEQTPAPPPRRPRLDLFIISFVILFFELACIRWFGSTVVFLTFFTNIVLLACFLGMSVGLLTTGGRRDFVRWVIPLAFISVALAMGTFAGYERFWNNLTVEIGAQASSPQLIYFGTEYRPRDPARFVVPMEAIAGTFFTLIAIMFVGLGQAMGRAFDAIDSRLSAYSIDVLGSLSGIALFALASWLELSPHAWFALVMVLLLYLARPWTWVQVIGATGVMFLISLSAFGVGVKGQVFWSPYYKISYVPQTGDINTNNISHQQMHDVSRAAPAYSLPHLLNRDAGGEPFGDVLIIGAGSGNDVSAALANGAKRIDAVEIDPAIQRIGAWDHPRKPYADPRVNVHLDDGRSFVRRTTQQYDLAVYALVDSLVLHSGYSSIRLESFLFTQQAFEDVKAKLRPGGVFVMYNYYRQGWVVARLAKLAELVFGQAPIVISLPHQEAITLQDSQASHITFLVVSADGSVLQRLREQFARTGAYWLNEDPSLNAVTNGFAAGPPTGERWQKIAPATVQTAGVDLLPSDDWPQLYLRDRTIPAHNLRGMALIAALSLAILLSFAPVRRWRPNGQMFFLGAGFMLLETKGVVHMALLLGSTWIVNSVVFFAILVMILCANLFVTLLRPRNLWPWYGMLGAALLLNTLVPMSSFLSLEGWMRTVVSCAVVFVPVFFAGVIFATSFRDSRDPAADFGSNVAGIILGGLSEYLSLVLGFNHLLVVAIVFYGLSALLRPRLGLQGTSATPA